MKLITAQVFIHSTFQFFFGTERAICLLHKIEERGMTMEQAMETVYSSHTYEKVERASTGLYFQGTVYVMDMLQEELNAA